MLWRVETTPAIHSTRPRRGLEHCAAKRNGSPPGKVRRGLYSPGSCWRPCVLVRGPASSSMGASVCLRTSPPFRAATPRPRLWCPTSSTPLCCRTSLAPKAGRYVHCTRPSSSVLVSKAVEHPAEYSFAIAPSCWRRSYPERSAAFGRRPWFWRRSAPARTRRCGSSRRRTRSRCTLCDIPSRAMASARISTATRSKGGGWL